MARATWAEDLVVAWYERNGYDIVARNFGDPFEAITPQKMLRIRRATAAFMATYEQSVKEIRFDFAAVLGARLEVRCGVA
jgi:Holliday junction resolvase-like predicted endonuclease